MFEWFCESLYFRITSLSLFLNVHYERVCPRQHWNINSMKGFACSNFVLSSCKVPVKLLSVNPGNLLSVLLTASPTDSLRNGHYGNAILRFITYFFGELYQFNNLLHSTVCRAVCLQIEHGTSLIHAVWIMIKNTWNLFFFSLYRLQETWHCIVFNNMKLWRQFVPSWDFP